MTLFDAPKTLEELRKHPYFVRLTEKQRVFVEALFTNGNNRVAAAHKAYSCSTDESAMTLANTTLRKSEVRFLVDGLYGTDPDEEPFTRDELMRFFAKKARTVGDEKLVYQYCRTIMNMNGWEMKAADPGAAPGGSMWDEVAAAETDLQLPKP